MTVWSVVGGILYALTDGLLKVEIKSEKQMARYLSLMVRLVWGELHLALVLWVFVTYGGNG